MALSVSPSQAVASSPGQRDGHRPKRKQRVKLIRSTPEQQAQARTLITIPQHPILADAITMLRKQSTRNERFRQYADLVAPFLLMEATRGLPLIRRRITTPLVSTVQPALETGVVYLILVLRAGFSLWDRQFLPKSRVATLGVVRDEESALAAGEDLPRTTIYHEKVPPEISRARSVIVCDPMFASAATICGTIRQAKEWGVAESKITFVSVMASVPGVLRLHQEYPPVKMITAALDAHLTEKWFIHPGLGDFGCRYFGTDRQD